MNAQICPFHTDEWIRGVPGPEGSRLFTCDRRRGHPGAEEWRWIHLPDPPAMPEIAGLAKQLDLATHLPEALAALGNGWFEYGLVEREYARRRPDDFALMVRRWGHTALAPQQYTVSSYLGGMLGRLSSRGVVAYHDGVGTGRWRYNSDISWWSSLPPGPWEQRSSWVDVLSDDSSYGEPDDPCREYMPGDLVGRGT